MDKKIIDKAKSYARMNKTSLSSLIENFLVSVTRSNKDSDLEISPLVKSLSGVLKENKKTDFKKQYGEHLAKKYK
jgi:hypothetical protein